MHEVGATRLWNQLLGRNGLSPNSPVTPGARPLGVGDLRLDAATPVGDVEPVSAEIKIAGSEVSRSRVARAALTEGVGVVQVRRRLAAAEAS